MSISPIDVTSASPPAGRRARWPVAVAWGALGLLLAVNLPVFLCMGPDVDISMYDLAARRVLKGDVHYRDLMETNFPGVIWIHMLVRILFGWRPEVLRVFDFTVVTASVWLLVKWMPRSAPAWGRAGLAGVLLAFYLSTSDWCHCQRDPWMLLPCLIALRLRATGPAPRHLARAFAEGVAWGVAVWIKPFVMVPGLACWLVSARATIGIPRAARRFLLDSAALVAGGAVVGAAGFGWLIGTGAWRGFAEVMFDWNREYFTFQTVVGPWWAGPVQLAGRFFPWMFVHLAAVPLAALACLRGEFGKTSIPPLLAAFYLGWLLQAFALQHLFDYVQVPPVMLAVTVLAVHGFGRRAEGGGWPVLAFLLACALINYPSLCAKRIPVWAECVNNGSTPQVRDRASLFRRIDWVDLDRVTGFLREQQVRDGEVTCFSFTTVSLQNDLDLRPSTRYLFLQEHLNIFVSRRAVILAALAASPQRFVVCDLAREDMRTLREAVNEGGRASPPCCRADRVVFRVGDYAVFRVDGPEMPDWLDAYFAR